MYNPPIYADEQRHRISLRRLLYFRDASMVHVVEDEDDTYLQRLDNVAPVERDEGVQNLKAKKSLCRLEWATGRLFSKGRCSSHVFRSCERRV